MLGREFIGTRWRCSRAARRSWSRMAPPVGTTASTVPIGHQPMARGEARRTGMLVPVFVAFRPEWLLTRSDARDLPRS